jgi:pyruvate dehydrogenase E2 component (dihydrolipoamide acetyltransferase)
MHIIMPKLGLTMTEGTLTKWRKAEGDTFKQGEILFEFESEKSALEFESPVTGVLTEILVAEGRVPCGTPVPVSTIQKHQSAEAATHVHPQVKLYHPPLPSPLQRQDPLTSHSAPKPAPTVAARFGRPSRQRSRAGLFK